VVPAPGQLGAGCAFASRCPRVLDECRGAQPPVRTLAPGHHIACCNPMVEEPADVAA